MKYGRRTQDEKQESPYQHNPTSSWPFPSAISPEAIQFNSFEALVPLVFLTALLKNISVNNDRCNIQQFLWNRYSFTVLLEQQHILVLYQALDFEPNTAFWLSFLYTSNLQKFETCIRYWIFFYWKTYADFAFSDADIESTLPFTQGNKKKRIKDK